MMNDDERIKLAIQVLFPTKGLKWMNTSREATEFTMKTVRLASIIQRIIISAKAMESTVHYKKQLREFKKGLSQVVKEKDEGEGI